MSSLKLSKSRLRLEYVASDFVTTVFAFLLFNVCRFYILHEEHMNYASVWDFVFSPKLVLENILIPLFLLGSYWLSGYYNNPIDKSRLQEYITTFYSAFVNTAIIFFALLLNDRGPLILTDYAMIAVLFFLLLTFTYIGRLLITYGIRRYVIRNNIKRNVILIGYERQNREMIQKFKDMKTLIKYEVADIIEVDNLTPEDFDINEIKAKCVIYNVSQIVLTIPKNNDSFILGLLDRLFPLNIQVRIMPDTLSYLTSSIRMTDIMAEPLIDMTSPSLSGCSLNTKFLFDKVVSLLAIILLSPLMLALMIGVKRSSEGPIFYKQERIGKKRKPFTIYKFRTMRTDAEKNGPALSSANDERITPFGRVLRKYRLDELPQFWNVLKGDMSLVGPRPEREYFIRQIIEKAPYYCLVFQVKPGITSWGMVKYGYATNLKQMVNRTKFDLIYITNMSVALDLKIIIYTFKTIIKGSGI